MQRKFDKLLKQSSSDVMTGSLYADRLSWHFKKHFQRKKTIGACKDFCEELHSSGTIHLPDCLHPSFLALLKEEFLDNYLLNTEWSGVDQGKGQVDLHEVPILDKRSDSMGREITVDDVPKKRGSSPTPAFSSLKILSRWAQNTFPQHTYAELVFVRYRIPSAKQTWEEAEIHVDGKR